MKETTKSLIEMALASDRSVKREESVRIRAALNGHSKEEVEKGLLLNMTQAAKFLGVSRTMFWRMTKRGLFSPVEISPKVFRYRRIDLVEFTRNEVSQKSA